MPAYVFTWFYRDLPQKWTTGHINNNYKMGDRKTVQIT